MIKSFICSTLVLLLVIAIQACSAKPPEQHLNFTEVEVIVDEENNLTMFMIKGEDFLFESPLEVTLGEFDPLIIISATDTQIDATLPFVIMRGDYVLTVSTGEGQSHGGDDLTIGAAQGRKVNVESRATPANKVIRVNKPHPEYRAIRGVRRPATHPRLVT